MAGGICPLICTECIKEGCLWYAPGVEKCAVVAIGTLVNTLRDLEERALNAKEREEQGEWLDFIMSAPRQCELCAGFDHFTHGSRASAFRIMAK